MGSIRLLASFEWTFGLLEHVSSRSPCIAQILEGLSTSYSRVALRNGYTDPLVSKVRLLSAHIRGASSGCQSSTVSILMSRMEEHGLSNPDQVRYEACIYERSASQHTPSLWCRDVIVSLSPGTQGLGAEETGMVN